MLFESLDGTIENLVFVFLYLIIVNTIIFGMMIYILFITEMADSFKYSRRIGQHVDQYFDSRKKIKNEPNEKTLEVIKGVIE